MYCRKKITNIFQQNLHAFYDGRKARFNYSVRKGNKINPTTIKNTQSNIQNDTTSLSQNIPANSLQSLEDQSDHISFTEEHYEDNTYIQEINRYDVDKTSKLEVKKIMRINHKEQTTLVDLHELNTITKKNMKGHTKLRRLKPLQEAVKSFGHTDALTDGTRHLDLSEVVISKTRQGDFLRLVGANQELSDTFLSSEGRPRSKGPQQSEGPQKSEGPLHNEGPPQSKGPQKSEGPPHNEGPIQHEGPPKTEGHPQSGSPSSIGSHSFTSAHRIIVQTDIENLQQVEVQKLLVMNQPLVAFKKVHNPNLPDMKINKLLINELFYDEEYIEQRIEQMVQRLSESNFFENKEMKINIEKIMDPATALLLLEYYGESSRIITILRKYFNF